MLWSLVKTELGFREMYGKNQYKYVAQVIPVII
jgi:hypothetical protein